MYNQDHNKAGTARRYLCSILKEHVNCYSIEVSMYGYNKKGMPGIMPYTEEGCILRATRTITGHVEAIANEYPSRGIFRKN